MSEGQRISAAPDVLTQEVEGELVLLDLAGERYWALDDIGARCWQLLVLHGEREAVLTALLAEFEIDEATLRSDVDALIEQLGSAGLIVVSAPGAAA